MPEVPLSPLSLTRAPAVSEEFSPLRAVRVGMDRVMPPDLPTRLARKWCAACGETSHDHIHTILASAIREALEEAEKALCIWCGNCQKRHTRDGVAGLWHVNFSRGENWAECKATAIAALRANLPEG